MTCRGIAKGNTIELDEPLPYPEGQPVRVAVEPLITQLDAGSPAAILKAMDAAPHLTEEDVAELAIGAVLVTRDSDFRHIAGLTVEDWSV